MVKNPNQFGKLSELEISDFELVNDFKLPTTYRDFLLATNGGRVEMQNIRGTSLILNCFLGMHNGDYSESLYRHIEIYAKRLPFDTLPMATDPFGNLFLLSVNPESFGFIYFWDHEGESEEQNGHFIDNVSFVAYSFEDLLAKLE